MAITLATLRDGARQLSDTENDDHISDTEINTWCNQAADELVRLIPADMILATSSFTISSGNEYTLPSDFLEVVGLDLNPGTSSRRTVPRFNFGERNDIHRMHYTTPINTQDRSYRIISRTTLIIEPEENATGDYKLWYRPRPATMTASVDLETELEPFAEFIMISAAIKCLIKSERDFSALQLRLDRLTEEVRELTAPDAAEPQTVTNVRGRRRRWY